MITTRPSVQANCSRVKRYICVSDHTLPIAKRLANRRHRRYLNALTRQMQLDNELFYDEPFNAPSLSTWDLW